MSRTRRAGTSSAAPQQEQEHTPEHVTVLLDLPGPLLAQIYKQLEVADRKHLCCTAPGFRECAEINALLTDCKVELGPDGNPTPETQLQHRPRHASPPKRLHISFPSAAPQPGSSHALLLFLRSCMQQEQAPRVLRGVQGLWLEVPEEVGAVPLSSEDAAHAAGMLGSLRPSVASLHLSAPVHAAALSLCPWRALRSLQLAGVQQRDVAAVSQLTQLRTLQLDCNEEAISVGCLSALTGLQSLSLTDTQLTGLPLVAQACSSLSQLRLTGIGLQPMPPTHPPQPPCTWPSLVKLELRALLPGVVSCMLPTSQAAPTLARLPLCKDAWPYSWLQGLLSASLYLCPVTAEEQHVQFEQLATDVRCLAACPVPCQALGLHLAQPVLLWAELAAALAPLGPTVTHLAMWSDSLQKPPTAADPSVAALLAQAMPRLQRVYARSFGEGDLPIPELPECVLSCHSLTHLEISSDEELSRAWVRELLPMCALASAAARPQGTLRVQLPYIEPATQQGSKQLWAQLVARVAAPASVVVVTDCEGTDLLAA